MNPELEPLAEMMEGVSNVMPNSFDGWYQGVLLRVLRAPLAIAIFAKMPVSFPASLQVVSRGRTLPYRENPISDYARTGDRSFDEAFLIWTSDPTVALRELTIPVRLALLSLAEVCPNIRLKDDYFRAEFGVRDRAIDALPAVAQIARILRDTPRARTV
jgi:hypothetical protein